MAIVGVYEGLHGDSPSLLLCCYSSESSSVYNEGLGGANECTYICCASPSPVHLYCPNSISHCKFYK